MAIEIISISVPTKVFDLSGVELATPGSAFRHITDCAMWPGYDSVPEIILKK